MSKQLNKAFLPSYFWLVLVAAGLSLFSTLTLAKQIAAGRVLMATVGVTAEQPNTSPRTLARRSVIFVGDTIKTPEGGRVQLRMNDGEMLSLIAASELIIDAFAYQPDVVEANNSSVKSLVTGGLRTITGAVKGDDYEMKSRAGMIGIRGTAFEAYTQQGKNMFVSVQSGNVTVTNSYGFVDIGVDQPLPAARIVSRESAPQAIPLNQLPDFVQDAFAEEPNLPAASNNLQQQNQQQTFNNPDFFKPRLPDSFSAGNKDVDLNDAAKDKQAEDAANNSASPDPQPPVEPQPPVVDPQPPVEPQPPVVDPTPVDPTPPAITYSGLVFSNSLDANQSQVLGGYFDNVIENNEANGSINYSASNGKPVFDFKQISNFNFNSMENWNKYVLGYSDIVVGSYACTSCIQGDESEESFYHYVFTTNKLSLDQLPASGEFNYTLNSEVLVNEKDFLTSGNLLVNFSQETMSANLSSGSLNWQGEGSLEAFYNSSIRLEAMHTNVPSDITGRFIGENAEGAITVYKLIKDADGVDYEVGTSIFEQP